MDAERRREIVAKLHRHLDRKCDNAVAERVEREVREELYREVSRIAKQFGDEAQSALAKVRSAIRRPFRDESPAHMRRQLVEALRRVLGDCEVALKSLPEDCLGEHPDHGWSFRNELLSNISDVLREVGDE
jgi:hypothetical protein